jgi:hypothetical protein
VWRRPHPREVLLDLRDRHLVDREGVEHLLLALLGDVPLVEQ